MITRLGLYGSTRGLYGDFSGKASEADGENPHNPGRITRLGLYGSTRGLYGSFVGKAESIPLIDDVGNHVRFFEQARREDEEILVLVASFMEFLDG